uniref:Uncharacterized protein n=1 Tax=Anguilla anguilla TaxID=7936 RepID=A0A0E9SRR5_ANGAN
MHQVTHRLFGSPFCEYHVEYAFLF